MTLPKENCSLGPRSAFGVLLVNLLGLGPLHLSSRDSSHFNSRLPLLLKERTAGLERRNSGRAWFEGELGPMGAEGLDSAGGREVEEYSWKAKLAEEGKETREDKRWISGKLLGSSTDSWDRWRGPRRESWSHSRRQTPKGIWQAICQDLWLPPWSGHFLNITS